MSLVAGRLPDVRHRPGSAWAGALTRGATADAAVCAGVAGILCLLAFVAQGGVELASNTYMQVVLVAGGALLGAAALAVPHRATAAGLLHGGRTLGLFGILALLTALSIAWSLDPNSSWLEANRTFAYLAAFAGTLAVVRLAPGRWSAILGGVGLACVLVCAYALATKVFPGWLAADEQAARVRAPFGYWNAVGLMAALGVLPLLWLASRRSGHAAVNALAYPGLGLLLVCLMLSYSRGSLLALAVGAGAWFALVPLRLRGAAALLLPAATTAAVVAWAFAQDGLTAEGLDAFQRVDAGLALGILLSLQFVILLAAGLVIGFAGAFRAPSPRTRTLAGRVVVGALVAALLAGVIGLAAAPGGIDGQVSAAFSQLTDPDARTPSNSPDRLTATASVRARYWDEAFKIHAALPWLGAGAGAYGTARQPFRTQTLDVQHAHGYVVQTLADLGWAGLLVSLAAMGGFLFAAARVLGLRRSDRGLAWDAERVGMATLAGVVLVFGVHSAVDWTWFIPANAVAALICAGWIAGRPPLRTRLAAEGPTGAVVAAERIGVLPPRPAFTPRERLLAWTPSPYRTVLALAVLLVGMAMTWTIVQPLRAEHAGDAVTNRLAAGEYEAAANIAAIAAERNPLSVEPWYGLATARASMGDRRGTLEALARAVQTQPANAEAWRRLGRYELSNVADTGEALKAFQASYFLDPQAPGSQSDVLEASRAAAGATP